MLFSPCLTLNVLCIFQQLWEDGCFTVDPHSSFLTLHFQSLILTGLTFFFGGVGVEKKLFVQSYNIHFRLLLLPTKRYLIKKSICFHMS